jgi:hypothetical protein
MSETYEYSFRTKTGNCTITQDQIILTREGPRGAAAERFVGSSVRRLLLTYALLGVGALSLGLRYFYTGPAVAGVIPVLIGVYLLWDVITSRNNSATPTINRSAVRTVEAHPPRPPLTRGYFAVMFREDGKEHKRLIMLPGSMNNGKAEYKVAEAAMRASGLIANTRQGSNEGSSGE